MKKSKTEIPLVRYLATCGFGPRRACDRLIQSGRVRINGKPAGAGSRLVPGRDEVDVDGQPAQIPPENIYLLLNKPRGYLVSDNDPEGRPLAKDLLPGLGTRLFPVGRLDFQTEGAILFTNDGVWANRIAHPRNQIPKTYLAKVRRIPSQETLKRWKTGIRDGNAILKTLDVKIESKTRSNAWLKVTLTGGVNRQVRRMGLATGHPVVKLIRIAIGPVELGTLTRGRFRHLHIWEIRSLIEPAPEPGCTERKKPGNIRRPGRS
ncbi:rRNA pseudouridine synthase [bacterium]|nr:rRNA pseudouridine synthase [candidate division CSSED10-310 bacterium]